MKIFILLLAIILVIIASCSQGYIVNMNEMTKYPEGRNLFVSKCNACHQLYSPRAYTVTEWDSILVPMKQKAKLNEDEKTDIYNWILEERDKPIKQIDSLSN